MPRYEPVDRSPRFLPVVLSEQIQPGTFEFALDHLVDCELDLSELDARFNNDETGASAYDPRVMLKIVLLAYSRGLVSSRGIERACLQNVQFIALSGDCPAPATPTSPSSSVSWASRLSRCSPRSCMTCDRLGLIGRQMFAIDGVKLPANASKERSGTHAELRRRAAAAGQGGRQDRSSCTAAATTTRQKRTWTPSARGASMRCARRPRPPATLWRAAHRGATAKGFELKANVTDNDSAKMATSKGVIQGYAAQAAVDSAHQVIVAADVSGSDRTTNLQALLDGVRTGAIESVMFPRDIIANAEDHQRPASFLFHRGKDNSW